MNDVTQYIAAFDPDIRDRLNALRQIFLGFHPNTEESIRYKMPAFKVGKDHLYFAAYKNHIGFYPVYGLSRLEDQIAPFRAKGTKDTLHFPHNKPLPIDLVKSIIRFKAGIEMK
ncbi:iron chaperone [Chitinophaga deserti]|uniref:iron chaperone n=1 Tax=Chitinophaga deserti TaxID=2164099 RepID=UPI000D6B73FC|nr:DUF1801 domain-containing protein [Chitinophaga deserti]